MSFDVVVFPFVPVTAIINALVYLEANSTSDIIFFFLSEGLDLISELNKLIAIAQKTSELNKILIDEIKAEASNPLG